MNTPPDQSFSAIDLNRISGAIDRGDDSKMISVSFVILADNIDAVAPDSDCNCACALTLPVIASTSISSSLLVERHPRLCLLPLRDGYSVAFVPSVSRVAVVDQARMMHLAELALDFARQWLKPGGAFLIKLFQGAGFDEYVRNLRADFERVSIRKPKASRARSAEVYALATGRRSRSDR